MLVNVVCLVFLFYSGSSFPAGPRHTVSFGYGKNYSGVEEGSRLGVGERTEQIDASGAVDGPIWQTKAN